MVERSVELRQKAGFTIVIEKSNNGVDQRKKYFVLGCVKGGLYKEPKRKLKKEDTRTRICQCPSETRLVTIGELAMAL
jgi:hypothetical protein